MHFKLRRSSVLVDQIREIQKQIIEYPMCWDELDPLTKKNLNLIIDYNNNLI